ncbi:MAG: RNA polymerase sigma factor [Bacteroidota bacterium]
MKLVGLSDKEIWSLFKNGDDRALGLIYSGNASRLYQYGLKFTADRDIVEDTIHDLFAELIKSRKNLGDTDNILYYLFKAFKHKLFRKLLREKHLHEAVPPGSNGFQITWPVEHELILQEISWEQATRLLRALNNLTGRQKEAIYLRFTRELDYASVAGIMEISVEACRNLICKAIAELKKSLNNKGENTVILFFRIFSEKKS